ncbi:MAG: DHHA1 domain-containing protein [Candidatus Methanomethylophilaceae archaeon]
MTDEIFRNDGYVFEFEGEVTSIDGEWVELGGTAFYPGGGGQVCDTGSMGGIPVTEVAYRGDDIFHKVPGHQFEVGDRMWCSVDWNRRYDLMMGHTAEHILFNALHRQDPEINIVKIYIGPDSKYVVVDRDIGLDAIGEAVKFANTVVRDNHPVIKSVMSRDDPEISRIRVKLDRIEEDEITVVEIGDVDIAACSGIHVMETSEIGAIFVDRKVSAGKGQYAIHFRIGEDATNASMDLANSCLRIIDELGSKPEDVIRTVSNMRSELEMCRRQLKETVAAYVKGLAPMEVGGRRVYSAVLRTSDKNPAVESAEAHRKDGDTAAFVCAGQNISVILASGDADIDCKAVISDVLAQFGGRGGGKKDFAQGGLSASEDPQAVLDALIARLSA